MNENIEMEENGSKACEQFLKEARQYILDSLTLMEERRAL